MPTHDILHEYYLLCRESMDYIRSQLNYYRASAYKKETADLIQREIRILKKISSMFSRLELFEIILDFETESGSSNAHQPPGECMYSNRLIRFINRFSDALDQLLKERSQSNRQQINQQLTDSLTKMDQEGAEGFLPGNRPGSLALSFFQKYLVISDHKPD